MRYCKIFAISMTFFDFSCISYYKVPSKSNLNLEESENLLSFHFPSQSFAKYGNIIFCIFSCWYWKRCSINIIIILLSLTPRENGALCGIIWKKKLFVNIIFTFSNGSKVATNRYDFFLQRINATIKLWYDAPFLDLVA